MELNDKLKHLSECQIEEVIRKYEDKSIKLANIITEYKIDVKPAGLLKLLPPIKTETTCIYCGNSVYQEREGRSSYNYDKVKYCAKCGHKIYPKSKYSDFGEMEQECECDNCITYRKQLVEDKKNTIRFVYGIEQPRINFSEIGFQNQVDLLYILLNNPYKNTYTISTKHLQSTQKEQWIRKINRLLDIKAISISPDSDISAFQDDDFPNIILFDKATYNVNVYFEEDTIEQINRNVYFNERVSIGEKLNVLNEYIYYDSISKFTEFLKERHLELIITESAKSHFIELIDKISYTQLIYLCNKVSKYFSDLVITGNIIKKVACNAALISVYKFYKNNIEKGYKFYQLDYTYAGDELRFYIERILGKKLELLDKISSIDNIETANSIVFDIHKYERISLDKNHKLIK